MHKSFSRSNFKKTGYLPDEELLTLLNIAVNLNKPILIEGPPGVGKTSFAKSIADLMGVTLFRIQCYEGITSEQIIGEFNYTKQLLAIESQRKEGRETKQDLFAMDYFLPRALFKSFLNEDQSVLLIDEIDRSDEEFEAFLLEALEEKQITVPELGTIKANSSPIIILTSNSTRELSFALKRRALYYGIDFPLKQMELEIIKLHFPNLATDLANHIIDIISEIRKSDAVRQPPSIAETLDFIKSLLLLNIEHLNKMNLTPIIGTLAKDKGDQREISSIFSRLFEEQ